MTTELLERFRAIRLLVFDFDGVFTDNSVYVFQDGRESVRCHRGDGLGLDLIRDLGLELLILSTERNPVVSARSQKLRIPCIQGCADKGVTLQLLAKDKELSPEQVAYVGNDVNDLSCLEFAGLPIVVADAHPDVTHLAAFRTERAGGQGAVREVCDLFASVLRPR